MFIDHAISHYEKEISFFVLTENQVTLNDMNWHDVIKELPFGKLKLIYSEYKDRLEILFPLLNENLEEEYDLIELNKKMIGVCSIAHNRDQRKQKDEAHWLNLTLFMTDFRTYKLLDGLYSCIFRDTDRSNQPHCLNRLYPFLANCNIYCNIYFIEKGKVFIFYQYVSKTMSYEPLLDTNLITFWKNESTLELQELEIRVSKKISELNLVSNSLEIEHCYFTDLGVDKTEITLFAEVKIKYSSKEKANFPFFSREQYFEKKTSMFNTKFKQSLNNLFTRNSNIYEC